MIFGITDNCNPSPAGDHKVALRHAFFRVVSPLGVDIGANQAYEIANVRGVENRDGIYIFKCCQNFCPLLFRDAGPAFSLERTDAAIRINGHNYLAAQLFGGTKIPHVANVQQIEAAVG